MAKVDFEVKSDPINESDTQYEMFIQGKRIAIPKDKEVKVDPIVKEIYRESQALARKANRRNPELVVFKDVD